MVLRLPQPADHAFVGAGVFTTDLPPLSLVDRLLARLAAALMAVHGQSLAREVVRQFQEAGVLGARVRLSSRARLVNGARKEAVRVGSGSVVRGILRNETGGTLTIGDRVYVGDDVIISSSVRVSIGDQTLVAHGVQVFDNSSHPLDSDGRAAQFQMILGAIAPVEVDVPSSPVEIGRDCWICANAILLPGTRVGDRSIVGAGSVVKGDVPPDVLYSIRSGEVKETPLVGRVSGRS